MKKRALSAILSGILALSMLAGCAGSTPALSSTVGSSSLLESSETSSSETKTPKYVFLFIGDGMSTPQIQLSNYFLSANDQDESEKVSVDGENKQTLVSKNHLTFMDFPYSGSAQTYDADSFVPDSASTATAIATGHKIWSSSINMSTDYSEKYETIAEKLKKQKNYKIGIVSSVNLNHATPAAFYSHQKSRDSYYEIGLEMIDSNFDYFAGGALKEADGSNGDQDNLYSLAEKAGYKVIRTQDEAEELTPDDGKAIVIDEHLADKDAMAYEIDRADSDWALADYVEKGIEVLGNDTGFFMMVEGGKIDWACHANDAASTIWDVIALDNAVSRAVDFYNEHPDETLILVTGDHETGGLTIGYAGTNYDTFLTNFNSQKISYAKYNSDYVAKYKENNTDFDTVMKDVTELFGLQAPTGEKESTVQADSADSHPESGDTASLVMTDDEYQLLQDAYNMTMSRSSDENEFTQDEYIKYGSYEPLTVTITHILNNKSGVNYSSYSHTGLPVEVLAQGAGAEQFEGYYDNTEIYSKMAFLLNVE